MSYFRPSAITQIENLAKKTGDTFTGDIVVDGGRILASPGDASAPGLAFNGDSDTGITQTEAGKLQVVTNGLVQFTVEGNRLTLEPIAYAMNGLAYHTNHIQDATTIATNSTATVLATEVSTAFKAFKFFSMARETGTGSNVHAIEFLIVHNGTVIEMIPYGEIATGSDLGSWTVVFGANNSTVRLLFTPSSSNPLSISSTYNALA